MKKSIFLSYPQPHIQKQQEFIQRVKNHLSLLELEPRTLGVSDYDYNSPLTAIRRLMLESNGLLTIAFKRTLIRDGEYKALNNIDSDSKKITNLWLTSPYCQIEPAMAFQMGLPVLVLREKGVLQEGILEKGVLGTYMPEFDLTDSIEDYFESPEWKQLLKQWESMVLRVYENRGAPPSLF